MFERPTLLGLAPARTVIGREPCAALPTTAQCVDPRMSGSGGCGPTPQALKKAYGEFAERAIFNTLVVPDGVTEVSELGSDLRGLLDALQPGRAVDRVDYLSCLHISEGLRKPVPIDFISLGRNSPGLDVPRDSSGCAFHTDVAGAFAAALGEWAERQCVVRYWITGARGCRTEMPRNAVTEHLAADGETWLLDISDPSLPGWTMLALYFSKRGSIRYACGSGFGYTSGSARRRAIAELWQNFRFAYAAQTGEVDQKRVRNKYAASFLSFNSTATRDLFGTPEPSAVPPGSDGSAERLLAAALGIGPNLYVHQSRWRLGSPSESADCYAFGFFSPEFFFHMRPTRPLNTDNRYRATIADVDPARLEMEIPIP